MRIGNAEQLEHALNRAVLAAAPVQRVEHHVGSRLQQLHKLLEIARHVDRDDVVALGLECLGAFLATRERDLALSRPAAHEHGDAGHGTASLRPAAGRPIRRISHSSLTPNFSKTRRRTSSPRPSISAAVASPVLIRKLVCFSETIAPPRVRPRQPARSISSHALWPAGLANVEPPVRARIGWLASRSDWIWVMR